VNSTSGDKNSTAQSQVASGAIQPAHSVQSMFDAIAPRYDVLNHVLSAGIDQTWWWRAARTVRTILAKPEAQVVDLCCGTGDMSLALLRHRPSTSSTAPILAVDFSHEMLYRGHRKFIGKNVIGVEGDALHLPLASGSADLISFAFGFRNLADYEDGLTEIYRVLRPGGQFIILECNQPDGLVGAMYNLYFKRVLPFVGGLVSSAAAYSYLPSSVERFPRSPRMLELIHRAGFTSQSWTSYTFGVAGLYCATKPMG
jgi:demethylmenaquinone methyltransferase/2-methoxy-6-polyprenyl-1,4-benzoquinol methylase